MYKGLLKSWVHDIYTTCLFCHTIEETRDHIFFSYPFSPQLWQIILDKQKFSYPIRDCEGELQADISCGKRKSFDAFVYKLLWTSSIYYVWQARN